MLSHLNAGRPKAPRNLSAEARRRWDKILAEYEIEDQTGLTLLETALKAFDEMVAGQKLLKADGLVTKDRFGCLRPHPAVQIVKAARAGMISAFRALRLDPITTDYGDEHGTKEPKTASNRRQRCTRQPRICLARVGCARPGT